MKQWPTKPVNPVVAIDTNVLVRYLTADDAAQARAAARLFTGGKVFLAKTVILEAEWVLRAAYGRHRDEIAATFSALAHAEDVRCEDEAAVRKALVWFAQGLDLADALHLASAPEGVPFATFDKRLLKRAGKTGIGSAKAAG